MTYFTIGWVTPEGWEKAPPVEIQKMFLMKTEQSYGVDMFAALLMGQVLSEAGKELAKKVIEELKKLPPIENT